MPQYIHIQQKPTFDLTQVELQHLDSQNNLAYFISSQVFKFDGVFGNLENRSRVLRRDKTENEYVIQIISATIDAGFCGHLVWKVQLTSKGTELLESQENLQGGSRFFSNCQQLHLLPSPAGNYYDGTNQTDLQPDVIFGM